VAPNQWHQTRSTADQSAEGIEDTTTGEAKQRERCLIARGVAHGGRTIGVRCLGDRRGDIGAGRRDPEDVTTGRGETPHRDLCRVNAGQSLRIRDRGVPVGKLIADAYDLARLTAAFPETAIVEREDTETGLMEPLREPVGGRLLRHGETTGHDHTGAVGPGIVPGNAVGIATDESNSLSLRGHSRDPRSDRIRSYLEVNHVVRIMSIGIASSESCRSRGIFGAVW
jgi:hypothetical protein